MSRQLDFCAVTSLLGLRVANQLWDRVTPQGIDLDFFPDEQAMTIRIMEREKQDMKCSVCGNKFKCKD